MILILLLLAVISNALPYHAHLFDGRPLAGDDSEIRKSSQESLDVSMVSRPYVEEMQAFPGRHCCACEKGR